MALRWIVPVLFFGLGVVAALLEQARQHTYLANAFGCLAFVGGLITLLVGKLLYPAAGITVIGTLTLAPEELWLQLIDHPAQQLSLQHDITHVTIRYEGYAGELVGRTNLSGIENFISLNKGPNLRFWVPDEWVTLDLQTILRSWYLRKVPLREYCMDSRTFLLTRDLSYEQIQIYKREFGVSLYN